MLKTRILEWLARRGVRIVTRNSPNFDPIPRNVEPEFLPIQEACTRFTCTSFEAQYGLFRAVEYVVRAGVAGDFVECGVYKGGSVMVAAMSFKHFGDDSRRFWLYDTFEGMPAPAARDLDFAGRTPQQHLSTWGAKDIARMAYGPIEEVKENLRRTAVAEDRFSLVKGKVEETIPATLPPGPISILRLDTDWYESTRHELEHLFPRVSAGGVIVIDDYGFWRGAREACDEYFARNNVKILLNRLDRIGAVIGVKPAVGK
jgi:O-methyltransferase